MSRVHNHAPWRPMCNERVLPDGTLRGACLPEPEPLLTDADRTREPEANDDDSTNQTQGAA